jgi:hypothetical protein
MKGEWREINQIMRERLVIGKMGMGQMEESITVSNKTMDIRVLLGAPEAPRFLSNTLYNGFRLYLDF